MKHIVRHLFLAFLAMAATTTSAQNNPYSKDYRTSSEAQTFGSFFVEYNPHTVHATTPYSSTNTTYQGFSIGFNYFLPVVSNLGIDAGLKGQYFFHKENIMGVKYKDYQVSATVPVDLVLDLKLSDDLAIDPFVGLYGRYNLIAKQTTESNGRRTSANLFEKSQTEEPMERFIWGWQAGVNLRVANTITIGAAYWRDLKDQQDDVNLYGFDIRLGLLF